ncbi:MAG: cardiolipin synthase [Betaproteobacteria bacterium]|nr:MAG: cardiolipin synthase [Betaproteobacteria bacterium]
MRKKRRSKVIAWVVGIFYVAGVVLAVDAIMRVRTAQGAIAWSVSLVTMPFVAVPAYLVLGRSKFRGMTEMLEARQDEIEDAIAEIRSNLDPWAVEVEQFVSTYEAVHNLSGMRLLRGNRVELLINGEATFDSILAGIAQAKEYALVQFYMFHDDGLGRRMKNALIERAKAGVRVYMLYDEIGSSGLPASYVNELRDAGVEVSSFKPTQGRGNRFQLNFRNHRKMVVVDGVTGWVGGHNVGDEYLGLDEEFSPWRDTHVRIDGPAVLQLQLVILGDWYWATQEMVPVNWVPQEAEDSDVRVMIYPSAPTQRLETAGLLFVTALHSARERIWLSAPYFVPDEAVMKALELAALRGVDVRIITTGKGDSLPVYLAAFHYIDQLRDLGIKFYAYKPGFLHEKVMLIDDRVSSVGTANFDNRSFRLNFEVTALIADGDFAKQMEAMFEQDFAHSEVIDPTHVDDKSFFWRLGVNLSRLASPVL